MSFFSETRGNDAAISTSIVTKLESMLAAHSAWVFVETYTTGGYETRTWKNLGSVNAAGVDFYLHIIRSTTSIATTTIYFRTSEGYNTGTHLATRLTAPNAAGASLTTPDATYNSYYGTTQTAPYTGVTAAWPSMVLSTISQYYLFVVTKNGLYFGPNSATSGASGAGGFLGVFESLWPTHPTEYPLCSAQFGTNTSSSYGTVARTPGATTASTTFSTFYSPQQWTPTSGVIPTTTYGLYGGGVLAARAALTMTGGTATAPYRGLVYDALLAQVDAAVAQGDTITYNGTTWVCIARATPFGIFVDTAAA